MRRGALFSPALQSIQSQSKIEIRAIVGPPYKGLFGLSKFNFRVKLKSFSWPSSPIFGPVNRDERPLGYVAVFS